jgi:hypothetical protein
MRSQFMEEQIVAHLGGFSISLLPQGESWFHKDCELPFIVGLPLCSLRTGRDRTV